MLIKKFFIILALISSFLFIAAPVFAQIEFKPLKDSGCLEPVKDSAGNIIERAVTLNCIPRIIGNVVFWLLVFAGIVALFLILISGFKFVTSGGEPKQAEGARKTLTFAIIGLVLILLSFAIVRFVADVTGVGCITKFGLVQCVPKDLTEPCSRTNPSGFCDGGKECLSTNDRPGDVRCQFHCSNEHKNGWCAGQKDCQVINSLPGIATDEVWGCK